MAKAEALNAEAIGGGARPKVGQTDVMLLKKSMEISSTIMTKNK